MMLMENHEDTREFMRVLFETAVAGLSERSWLRSCSDTFRADA